MVLDEVPGTGRHKTIVTVTLPHRAVGTWSGAVEGTDGGWMSVFTGPIKSF